MKNFENFVNEGSDTVITEKDLMNVDRSLDSVKKRTKKAFDIYQKVLKILDEYNIPYELGNQTTISYRLNGREGEKSQVFIEIRPNVPSGPENKIGYNYYTDVKPKVLKAGAERATPGQIWIQV